MAEESGLKPCPICGSDRAHVTEIRYLNTGRKDWEFIHFCALGVDKPFTEPVKIRFKANTREDLLEVWNTRYG